MQVHLHIGLFGFGTVGEALYQVLQQTESLKTRISKVCIRHPEKPRTAPAHLFTTSADRLLDDPTINVIVELIDDADAAYDIVRRALTAGKAVVSANKKMIATHLPELLALQKKHRVPFLYEAACCASIPVLRNLEEYYDNDLLQGFEGIVNGSTNYILTSIAEQGLSYETALKRAQEKGFAESDPSLDVKGTDAANKLTILLAHSYGIVTPPERLVHRGIDRLRESDAVYAREKGFALRLVAQARKLQDGTVAAFVLPQFVDASGLLGGVKYEYNGLVIESSFSDRQFFYGKGAGGLPTASAVLSDLSALRYGYRYEYRKQEAGHVPELAADFYLNVYVSFDSRSRVPEDLFHRIDEWIGNSRRSAVSGVIPFRALQHDWWREPHVSLVLQPDAILESAPDSTVSEFARSFIATEVLN